MADIRRVIEVEVKESGVDQATEDLKKLAGAANEAETESKQLGEEVDQTATKFVRLERQVRNTRAELQKAEDAGDEITFNKLKAELDELEDKLEINRIKSAQFDDQLSLLPGTAGQVGNAIKSVDGTLKVLAANKSLVLLVGSLTAVIGSFALMKEALQSTEEGQKKLSAITEKLGKLLNGLFAAIEPIAFALADLVVALLDSKVVMTTIEVVAGTLSAAFNGVFVTIKSLVNFFTTVVPKVFSSIGDQFAGLGKMIKGVFTFDADTISQGFDQLKNGLKKAATDFYGGIKDVGVNSGKAFVDGYTSGTKGFNEGLKRTTEKVKEQTKVVKEARKEAQKQYIKDEQAFQLQQLELEKAQSLSLAQTAEERKQIELKYETDVYNIKKKFLQDKLSQYKQGTKEYDEYSLQMLNLETARLNQITANVTAELAELDRRNKEADRLLGEQANKKVETDIAAGKAIDSIRTPRQGEKTPEDKINEEEASEQERLTEKYNFAYSALEGSLEDQLKLTEDYENRQTEIRHYYDKKREEQAKKTAEANKRITAEEFEAKMRSIADYAQAAEDVGVAIQSIAGKNKKVAKAGVIIEKAAAVAKITATAAGGATAAFAAGNYAKAIGLIAMGVVQVANTVKAAKESITAIDSTQIPGDRSSGGNSSVGGSSAPSLPSFSQGSPIMAPQIGVQQSQSGQIAGLIAGNVERGSSQSKPIRAYVVQDEIKTNANLDRRLGMLAKL